MSGGGLPIARLFGIEIRVSLAWSVLIAVVTVIGAQQAAAGAPQLASAAHILVGALVALGFLASVIAHELAHALVGRRRGVEARTIVLGFAGGLAPLSIEAGGRATSSPSPSPARSSRSPSRCSPSRSRCSPVGPGPS